jgi:two-component system NtrC family sensor kinase
VAVNAAETVDDAFAVLAQTGLELLGAARASIAVWDDSLTRGVIRAAAGEAAGEIGAVLLPGAHAAWEAVSTGQPIHDFGRQQGGLPPAIETALSKFACVIAVPLERDSASRITFHAGWIEPLDDDELVTATEMLSTLGRLTAIARRAERERNQAETEASLQATIEAVAEGVAEQQREFANEQYLRAVFDAIPTAILLVDPTTRAVVSGNRAFCELVGYQLDDVVGSTPPYPWWAESDPVWSHGDEMRYERLYRRADSRLVPVQVNGQMIRDHDDRPLSLLALITDLSERRRLEQQLVQSGKLAAIGELAAGVAHEINNPLFAILGLVEFLIKDAESGSKTHERLQLVQQTGLEIKEIVRSLLDFARENSEERHFVALEEVVFQTVDLVRRTSANKGVEIIERYNSDAALVNASPNQIKQIFLNLLANARQAMPGGGSVTIDVHCEADGVLVTVSDTGAGIPEDTQSRIFEPFFTTKRDTGGTGLGLPVSLGIAEAHGGSLTVESKLGEGAAFTLRLPRAEEGAA